MTNKELQEMLKKYPEDLDVFIDDEFGLNHVREIRGCVEQLLGENVTSPTLSESKYIMIR